MPTDTDWIVRHLAGTAHELHHRPLADAGRRVIEVCRVRRQALVLGSTQAIDAVDPVAVASAGIEVARRRSGGGAVLLDPVGSVWIDVTVPRGDELWDDDVNRSFLWLGERWAAALAALGHEGTVHRGPTERSASSSLVCFAGLGAGEVVVDGRKFVGLSQRRTRDAARFQSVVSASGMPAPGTIVELLAAPADPEERAALRDHLEATVGALEVPAPAVIDAVLAAFV